MSTYDTVVLVEDGFRRREVRVLTCTSTLSMGVNLPSRNVIIYGTTKFNGSKSVPIAVADYKNMAGRAGRYSAGDEYGSCYLLAPSQSAKDTLTSNYVKGNLEGFASAFGDQLIDMQALQIIAGSLASDVDSVSDFVLKTYNGKFKWRTEQSKKAIRQMVADAVAHCVQAGAVEQLNDRKVAITAAGKLCASSGFSLDHLGSGKSYLSNCSEIIEASVIYWALKTDYECGPSAYHIARVRTQEYQSKYYQRLLAAAAKTQRLGRDVEELASHPESLTYNDAVVVKRSLACLSWISDMPTKKILDMFPGVTVGAIRNTSEACARLTTFLYDLAKLEELEATITDDLSGLTLRLSHGSTKEGLRLAMIRRSGVSRDERNHLVENGIDSIDDLLSRDIGAIPLPRAKVSRLLKAIEDSITDDLERRRRSQKTRLHALGIDTSILDALYTAQGQDLESAIDELLKVPFLSIVCRRVSHQTEGEPDHIIYTSSQQTIVVQTTARERARIAMKKATSVVGQSSKYKPIGYIVFGRPDFDELSVKDSANQVSSGRNYKLIPVCTLAEMYVLYHEKRITSASVEAILVAETGYIGIKQLYERLKRIEPTK